MQICRDRKVWKPNVHRYQGSNSVVGSKHGSVVLGKNIYLKLLQNYESILSILDWNECYRKYVHCLIVHAY